MTQKVEIFSVSYVDVTCELRALKTGYLNKTLPVILGQSCLLSVGGYGYFHLFILSCNCIVFAACVVLVVVT